MRIKLLLLAEVLFQRAVALERNGDIDAGAAVEAVSEALREVLGYNPEVDDPLLSPERRALGLPDEG